MSKFSHGHQSNTEFPESTSGYISELTQAQISHLAKDYYDDKQELEITIKQLGVAKLVGTSAVVLASLGLPPPIVLLGALIATTIDTKGLAVKVNELKRKIRSGKNR